MIEWTSLAKGLLNTTKKNLPVLLTSAGATGVIATALLAVRNHKKAEPVLEEDFRVNGPCESRREVVFRWVKVAGPHYIPAIGVGALSIACIIGSHHVTARRHAALLGVYTLTEKAFSEYKTVVREELGEEAEKAVKDAIDDRHIKEAEDANRPVILGVGETLCFDSYSGRFFRSDLETLRSAVNSVNYEMIHEVYVSLNRFYDLVGIDGVKQGDDIGWNSDRLLDLNFTTRLDERGRPCLVVEFDKDPSPGYGRLI